MSFRRWAQSFIGIVIIFVLLNYILWKLFTKDLLTFTEFYNGGLDRLAYIVGSKHYRKPESTLPRQHIPNTKYHGQPIDALIVGDSFINENLNGRDPLYQDWIATLHGLNVLNAVSIRTKGKHMNQFETIIALMNSGYLDVVNPRFVIMEGVERNATQYAKQFNFTESIPLDEVKQYYAKATYGSDPEDVGFINTGNAKFLLYSILHKFSDNAFFSKVYKKKLDRPLFSVKNSDLLLFYGDDFKHIPLATPASVMAVNQNLNTLADLLRRKGIVLYFLLAANKYTVYSDYIIDNQYPRSTFFELLRPLPKKYTFIDTKAILIEEIRKGEKDIYYADDSHWSWKAVKKIAESTKFSR